MKKKLVIKNEKKATQK